MKIRTDFITNSSSSSFVAYAVYSEELWAFIQTLINDGDLENKDQGPGEYYGPSVCSYLKHIDQGISITGELAELKPHDDKEFHIFHQEGDVDDRSVRDTVEDNENACNLEYLHAAISHFFNGINSDILSFDSGSLVIQSYKQNPSEKDIQLDAILEKAFADNKVRSRTFLDHTDGFGGDKIFNVFEPPIEFWIEGDTLAAYSEQPDVTHVQIPDTIKRIGECAFQGCSNITSIDVPGDIVCIEDLAFDGCISLDCINFNSLDDLLKIEYGEQGPCWDEVEFCIKGTTVKDLSIPDGVSDIGEYAFYSCISLEKLVIQDGVTIIGKFAFMGCVNLTDIFIPDSVTDIGWWDLYQQTENLTIHGHAGSYAEEYAKNENIKFNTIV